MCHWAVQWVAKRDKQGKFYFAPLKGITAQEMLRDVELPDSICYFEDEKLYFYSKACFRIAWQLGGLWKVVGFLSFLPDWALYPANLVYREIAKRRSKSCDISVSGAKFLP